MTNVEALFKKLNAEGITIGGLTLGPKATPELVAGEILRSLEEFERDELEFIEDVDADSGWHGKI
jgi:hypothetical protein